MSEATEAVFVEQKGDFAILRLGSAEERLSVLTKARMDSLESVLTSLQANPPRRGLIVTGPKGNAFCAGADVNIIRDLDNASEAKRLAERGQNVFNLIAALPCPTLAAISGACVGGGCELALACDYRIMADSSAGTIGLPEVQLGIIPGFGGTQRLPRLIGLRPALDIILKGRQLNPRHARSIGLVDELIKLSSEEAGPEEVERKLLERALSFLETPPKKQAPSIKERFLMTFPIARSFAESTARATVQKETQGLYPAPIKALETVFVGLKEGIAAGLAKEAEAIGTLLVGDVCKSLMHIYFLREDASKLGRSAKDKIKHPKAAILGGGTMGAGIAECFLSSRDKAVVVETSDAAKRKAHAKISGGVEGRRSWSTARKKQALENLKLTVNLPNIEGSDIVIEAIIEDLETKAKLLRSAATYVQDNAIIASNTSSLSISTLSETIPHPERVVGMHFFNPAPRMPLVEIVMGSNSSNSTVALAAAFATHLGKFPVVVRDVPGFLVNRVFAPYMVEAAYLLSAGYGIEIIDRAAKNFGLPMGPLRLLDEVGLDVASKVSQIMESSYGLRMRGPRHVDELVRNGLYGRKNGAGFYTYTDKSPQVNPDAQFLMERSIASRKHGMSTADLRDRLILPMVNEAVRCFDEGVAGKPGAQAAGQIDLATVMGMGFPPCYGGIMRYAEARGAKEVERRLRAFAEKHGERHLPAEGIVKRAQLGKSFYESV